jgi:pimeloyl-ACP methyl ester carboxylesterase
MKLMTYLRRAAATALLALSALAILNIPAGTALAATAQSTKPTIILVHGAFADSSSWDSAISKLQADGYKVIAAPDELRSLKGDSDYVSGIIKSVAGQVVLVGHSYGGAIITNAANGANNVKALVYVAAFAPDAGEAVFDLAGKFPGSNLPQSIAPPIALANGAHDLYVQQEKFWQVFAADIPEKQAKLMAATQRPAADVALKEASGPAAWKTIPSWFIYGSADKIIPPAAHAFMAQRAGAKETIVVKGASHVVMVSNPVAVAKLIEKAAATSVK